MRQAMRDSDVGSTWGSIRETAQGTTAWVGSREYTLEKDMRWLYTDRGVARLENPRMERGERGRERIEERKGRKKGRGRTRGYMTASSSSTAIRKKKA
jgi:hypothetical protein